MIPTAGLLDTGAGAMLRSALPLEEGEEEALVVAAEEEGADADVAAVKEGMLEVRVHVRAFV